MNLLQKRSSSGEGEWVSWNIDGRAGAKLRLGPVFLGEISYPHDLGLGARWRAWLNHEHLGFFRNEREARARIEAEIVKRLSLMRPAWSKFRRARSKTGEAIASPRRKSAEHLVRSPDVWRQGTNELLAIADRPQS